MASFSVWDYLVLGIVLMISAIIGVYYKYSGGKQKTNDEYLLGNRSMSTIPVSLSLMASTLSAIAILGGSMESYQNGTGYALFYVGVIISAPIVNFLILPVFYNLQVSSLFEYFTKRFGYSTRIYMSVIFTGQTILVMGIVLFAPVLALEAATGIDRNTAICLIGLAGVNFNVFEKARYCVLTPMHASLDCEFLQHQYNMYTYNTDEVKDLFYNGLSLWKTILCCLT
uniref:Sodium-dependent multivitamin transporter n=1 Tax=Megaselia scalaris TaxID=36166 RepID=T1H3Y5_MEGSC